MDARPDDTPAAAATLAVSSGAAIAADGPAAAMPVDVSLGAPALTTNRLRIVVAMSGGVDSSVVAGLLAREGHDVVGITLQLYDHGAATARKGSCCAGQDIHDARRVADKLAIPHYVLDYEERFRTSVIDSFADSYLAGETPIPCVTCNQTVKFRDLLETARELGADALATGHYIERRAAEPAANARPTVYRAADADRDQSYFLFATTRAQLDFLRFPLGTMSKAAVRALASDLALPVATKADSQDICFVPAGRYTDIIERLKPGAMEAGDIVDEAGRVLARHAGIAHFTVGQRRGIGIAAAEPLFVLRVDAATRQVVVGPKRALAIARLTLRDTNWLGDVDGEPMVGDRPLDVHVRVRSTGASIPALLVVDEGGRWVVELGCGTTSVARGQACVIYADGDPRARLLGGGFIATTHRATAGDVADTLASAPATSV